MCHYPPRSLAPSSPPCSPIRLQVQFRSLASFAKHGLFFMEFDLSKRSIAPRLAGRILARHWFELSTEDGHCQWWYEMFSTREQTLVRHLFVIDPDDARVMHGTFVLDRNLSPPPPSLPPLSPSYFLFLFFFFIVTSWLLIPSDGGAAWTFVRQLHRIFTRR